MEPPKPKERCVPILTVNRGEEEKQSKLEKDVNENKEDV